MAIQEGNNRSGPRVDFPSLSLHVPRDDRGWEAPVHEGEDEKPEEDDAAEENAAVVADAFLYVVADIAVLLEELYGIFKGEA